MNNYGDLSYISSTVAYQSSSVSLTPSTKERQENSRQSQNISPYALPRWGIFLKWDWVLSILSRPLVGNMGKRTTVSEASRARFEEGGSSTPCPPSCLAPPFPSTLSFSFYPFYPLIFSPLFVFSSLRYSLLVTALLVLVTTQRCMSQGFLNEWRKIKTKSNWLRKKREIYKPITKRRKIKPKQTRIIFDTHLKTPPTSFYSVELILGGEKS